MAIFIQLTSKLGFQLISDTLDNSHAVFQHPAAGEAFRIIDQLRDAGFVAYLAGGCVRDALLNRRPKDFDVATSATPESVREVFGKKNTLAFGASFGVIGVLPGNLSSEQRQRSEPTEVATFRSDGEYSDGRRPDSVQYGNAKEDTQRRDFTINGLFYDPHDQQVIDYVGGQEDLKRRLIRTIGNAADRFSEDKLRMLRAIRFSTVLGFEIEPTTMAAVQKHASAISVVSGERIGAEMRRVIASPSVIHGLKVLRESRLESEIFPSISGCDLVPIQAAIQQLSSQSFVTSMACIMIAGNQSNHEVASLAKHWRLSNEEERQIVTAIRSHQVLIEADQLPWSTVQPCLINRDANVTVVVAQAIAKARDANQAGVDLALDALSWPPEKLNPAPLITGQDLAEAGIPAGPAYKEILQTARDQQLDKSLVSKEQALELAQAIIDRQN